MKCSPCMRDHVSLIMALYCIPVVEFSRWKHTERFSRRRTAYANKSPFLLVKIYAGNMALSSRLNSTREKANEI